MNFFPDLKTGMTLATLRIEGNTPNLKHALKRIDNIGAIYHRTNLYKRNINPICTTAFVTV